jgi:hypothetical protein
VPERETVSKLVFIDQGGVAALREGRLAEWAGERCGLASSVGRLEDHVGLPELSVGGVDQQG